VRNEHRFLGFLAAVSWRQFLSIPASW
jgi:hypothetical protein